MIGEEMNHLFLFFVPVFQHLLSGLFNSFDFFNMLTREAIFPEWSVSLLVFLRCPILSLGICH